MKDVHISALKDVFTDEEIKEIKKIYQSESGQCHYNSAMFTSYGIRNKQYTISFCCGYWYVLSADGKRKIKFDHCWNKVVRNSDGKEFYVDLTFELANANDDLNFYTHCLLAEYSQVEIVNIFTKEKQAFNPYTGHYSKTGLVYYRGNERLLTNDSDLIENIRFNYVY